jgi:hypothetical protein
VFEHFIQNFVTGNISLLFARAFPFAPAIVSPYGCCSKRRSHRNL